MWARSSTAYLFQLINTGTVPVTVDSVAADETLLNVAPDSVLTVAVGDTADLMVTLMPPQTGEVNSYVVFFTSLGEYDFPVKATVVELWPLAWRQTADITRCMENNFALWSSRRPFILTSRVVGSFIEASIQERQGDRILTDIRDQRAPILNMLAVSDEGRSSGNLASPARTSSFIIRMGMQRGLIF